MRARLAALLLGLALSALLVEAVARWTWTAPWTERLIAEQKRNLEHGYLLNDWGLRDREYPAPRPAGRSRLLILGDSFTFGQGVFDDAAIFPAMLERRLDQAAAAPSASGVDVLNGGLAGTLTGAWVRLWLRIADAFDPDAVLVVFFLRDGTSVGSNPDFFDRIRDEIAARNRTSRLYRFSYAVRWLRDRLDRTRISSRYAQLFHDAYFGDEGQTGEWRRAQRNLLRLRDLAGERGVPIGLAVFPILVQLDDDYPFREICERVLTWGEANGFAVHDLLPAFLGQRGPELWVSPVDQHPNARAHAIAAESLLPFARRLLSEPG